VAAEADVHEEAAEEEEAEEEEEAYDAHRNAAAGAEGVASEYAEIERVWAACASLARCHPLLQVS
jgi:hypothetical protein